MRKKTPAELEEARIIKTTRTLIRLKYSLEADEEINDVLPDRLDDFYRSLQQGKLKELPISLDEVLNANSKKTA